MIKKILQDLSGYYIHKQSELEIGASLQLDINRFLGYNVRYILDIGANVGQSALYYARIFRDAKIYSFEPFSEAFNQLLTNTKKASRIVPVNLAVSDYTGEVEAHASLITADSTNSLRRNNQLGQQFNKEIIKCIKLDDWLQECKINSISFMKVDVEGFELNVIDGANQSFVNNAISLALFETGIGSNNTWNTPLSRIIEAMSSYGYELIGLYDTSLIQLQNRKHYTNALFASPMLIDSLPPLAVEITNKGWPFQSQKP